MARGYLNDRSFPADTLEAALDHLSKLRAGITILFDEGIIEKQVLCAIRASNLLVSSTGESIAAGQRLHGGRYRDTILFFLQTLDQSSPVYAHLDAVGQEAAVDHVLDDAIEHAVSSVLVASALDNGVLLSIGTSDRWRRDRIAVRVLLPANDDVQQLSVDNVYDAATAGAVSERLRPEPVDLLVFGNWIILTDDAGKSAQIDDWFHKFGFKPGFETAVMRSLRAASAAKYLPDGKLVKKLTGECDGLYEVRIHHDGSNNVRLLFAREAGGRVLFGYAGIKTSEDWYHYACGQAHRHIKGLRAG